jgi:conjugal transfer ATP-binding protein TraC
MLKFIFGERQTPLKRDILKKVERTSFSSFLPWYGYDEETRLYHNHDDTQGFIWECRPLAFASQATGQTLEGLFRLNLPVGSILQFSLLADSLIEPVLDRHESLRSRDSEVGREAARSMSAYLREGRKGMPAMAGIPLRQFRLFVSLKFPVKDDAVTEHADILGAATEILKGALLQPELLPPGRLLDTFRRLFNEREAVENDAYDPRMALNDQVIFAETGIHKGNRQLVIGEKVFKCATVKKYPLEVNLLQTNELLGGISGLVSNSSQVTTPFLCTVNIVFHDLKTRLHSKSNLILSQQSFGSFAPSLARKKEEHLDCSDKMERGITFVRVMPILWVWSDDEAATQESLVRIMRVWESHGYIMQYDRWILDSLFVAALPFGLYDIERNIDIIRRDVPAPADAVSAILPVQADFTGGGDPVMLMSGRKGQLVTFDIFDRGTNNFNMFVAASTGSGKSFFVNYLVSNYYATGAKVRIVDVGKSYQKMTKIFGARFLDFDENSGICLNPFSNIDRVNVSEAERKEYMENALCLIAAVVMQMCYSSTDVVPPDEAESSATIVRQAVKWAWERYGAEACVDRVYDYLANFESFAGEFGEVPRLSILAKTLAFNLTEFTTGHLYGRWFNGRSDFDIGSDEFVVLELQHLRPKPELFKVVTLQVINAVSHDYISDRSTRKVIVFDEVWQFLREGVQLREVIEAGYRMARKYLASITVVSQSLLDLKQFGSVGDVIRANSAYKILLESPDYEKARQEGLLDYDDFTMRLLTSVKSMRPHYSELFIDAPYGRGVARLSVDPYSYYCYTSDGREVSEIASMVDKGMSYDEAIREMVRKYRGGPGHVPGDAAACAGAAGGRPGN